MRPSRLSYPLNRLQLAVLAAIVSLLALMLVSASADAAWQTGGQLASGTTSPLLQATTGVANPTVSKDGHYAFFASRSGNLNAAAPNGGVFRKNLWNDAAAIDVVAAQPAGVTNANCGIPIGQGAFVSASADGRYVAFSTSEDGLVAGDTNGRRDVYVRDMNTAIGSGAFSLVSASSGSVSAPTYSLTDLGGGSSIPVPATDNCMYGAELPGPNSISNDGKKVIFSNTAFTSISSASGTNTAPGNLWVRSLDASNATDLVTRVAVNYNWNLPSLPNPSVTVGGPLPDQEYFDSDPLAMARTKTLASISGDGSAVVWAGAFARYQTAYNGGESDTVATGDYQSTNYLYRRIAEGAAAKTRRAISWADLDDPNCDPNLAMDYLQDPDPASAATYNKRLACIGPFSNDLINANDARTPAISDDGRKVFVLAGMPGHFLTEYLSNYPLDLISTDLTPGVSRKAGTKWVTRATAAVGQPIEQFAINADGTRAVVLTTRRSFSNTGLVATGTFPATTNSPALFAIDGTLGSVSGESAWSGAPIEWAGRPTAGTTDPLASSYLPNFSLDGTGHRLVFGSKDPAYFSGANSQYQALCVTDTAGGCPATPAAAAPVVTIGGPVNGGYYSGDVYASYSATNATSVSCTWDSEAVLSPCPASPLPAKTLANGAHTFSVTASNGAGSTTVVTSFNVGSPPAAATISSPLEGASVDPPLIPTYSVSGSPTRVRCWYDNTAWVVSNNTSDFNCPATLPGKLFTSGGTHTFSVTTSNEFGSTTTTRTFQAKPSITLTRPVDGAVYAATNNAAWTVAGQTGNVLCRFDAVAYATCTSPKAFTGLANGTHSFSIQASNAAGTVTIVRSFTIASTPPTVSITNPVNGATNVSSPVSPTWTLGGGAAVISCQWDSEPVITGCTQALVANKTLTSGAHTFKVTAAGTTTVTATSNFTVSSGTLPPTVSITSPTQNQTVTSPVSPSFTLGGGAATSVTCQFDSAPVVSNCTPASIANTVLGDGAHTLVVTAANGGGSATDTRNFTVLSPPTVSVTGPSEGQTVTSPVSPSFTLGGGTAASVTCKFDAAPTINGCTQAAIAATVLAPGAHQLVITATNASGSASVTRNFTVLAPPTVSITAPTEGQMVTSPVSPAFTLGGGTATGVTCQFDATPVVSSCTQASIASTALAAGAHTLVVTATNAAGSATDTRHFSVLAPPTVSITAPTEGQTLDSPVFPAFTLAGGAATTVTCQFDSAPVINSCTPASIAGTSLGAGAHTLVVTASNAAGSNSDTRHFTIVTAPTVTIDSPAQNASVTSPVSPVFTLGGGPATSVTCQFDSAPVITVCTPASLAGTVLSPGAHTLNVIASNIAGLSTATRNFSVLEEPSVVSISPADGAVNVASPVTASFTLGGGIATSISCQWDEDADITPCASPLAPKSLTPGEHSLTVTASNAAGVDTLTSTFTVLAAPTVTIGAPTQNQTVGSPVHATFTLGGGVATNVTCTWDAEPVITSCTSPLAAKALTPGTHTLTVAATNAAGSASVTRNFTVAAVPQIAITAPADGATVGSPVTAAYSTVGADSVSCRWDAEAVITPCPANPAPKTLTSGSHSFRVEATNAAGTTASTSTFTVVAAPTVSIGAPAAGSVQTSPVGAQFTLGGGPASSVTCQWDSEAAFACTSPVGGHTLGAGSHTFRVTAANAAASVTATTTFTVPAGDYLKVGALTVIANFPRKCQLPGDSIRLAPYARFKVSNVNLEKALAGNAAVDTWGELLPAIEAVPNNSAGRTTEDCQNLRLRRVIRRDSSTHTDALKNLLAAINPARGWTSTYAGTTWPRTSTTVVPSASGAAAVAAKVRATQNSIGYVDLETARDASFRKLAESSDTINPNAYQYTNANDLPGFPANNWTYQFRKSLFWIPLESTLTPGTFVEPTLLDSDIRNSRKRGSRCPGVQNGDDWTTVTGTSIPTSVYPLCVVAESASS